MIVSDVNFGVNHLNHSHVPSFFLSDHLILSKSLNTGKKTADVANQETCHLDIPRVVPLNLEIQQMRPKVGDDDREHNKTVSVTSWT